MKEATSIGTDLTIKILNLKKGCEHSEHPPVMQGHPEAGSPAQSVGGRPHPLVDPDLDEVGIGNVGDHVVPVVGVVTSTINGPHLRADA